MLRRLLLAAALVSLVASPLCARPLWAKPASSGVTVEIGGFEYTYFLSADDWSMTCRTRGWDDTSRAMLRRRRQSNTPEILYR